MGRVIGNPYPGGTSTWQSGAKVGFGSDLLRWIHACYAYGDRYGTIRKACTMDGPLALTSIEGATTDNKDGSCNFSPVLSCPQPFLCGLGTAALVLQRGELRTAKTGRCRSSGLQVITIRTVTRRVIEET